MKGRISEASLDVAGMMAAEVVVGPSKPVRVGELK